MNQSESAPSRTGRRPGRTLHIVLWAAQILLAAFFLFQGGTKLAGAEDAVRLFDDIGMGDWLRYFTGVVEIAGAIGLLIPRVYGLAALGLAGVMVGATATNLSLGGDYTMFAVQQTIPLAVVFALLAWARRSETQALITTVLRRD